MTTTIHTLASEAYEHFTTKVRGEDTIVVLKDDAPEWVGDLVREAHGADFLPDDWRYAAIRSALGAIAGEATDEIDDLGAEWADGHVDVYTHARLKWLASNLTRVAYCDEAREEYGEARDGGIVGIIGMGQYAECREVFGFVRGALESELEAREDDEQDEPGA